VLYLLDGNACFPLAWHALQALQERLPAARELALVGIGYPAAVRIDVQRRYHDLTPPTPAERMQGRSGVTTGGQEVFLDFIEHDLRPAIAQRLAVDPQRQALFGHSLGGLLTLHALYTRPHLFQTWLAADPSLWWDGGSILREEQAFLAGVQAAGNRLRTPLRLLIERSGGSRRTARAERPAAGAGAAPAPLPAEVLDSARRLARVEGMQVAYHRFANESHGSMVAPSIRDGLAFLLGAAPEHLDVL
jgi:predicted alpha/beta superfamily hydrolase